MARHLLFSKIRVLLFALIAVLGYRILTDQLNDRFSIKHVTLLTPQEKGEERETSLLNQKFSYLGKGSQAYIFLGEDQTTILKLFRFNRFQTLPFSKKKLIKENKKKELFESLNIATNEIKDECGLLFSHLGETRRLPKKMIIKDKLNRTYKIDPNKTYFLLQKKGTLLYPFLLKCKETHDLESANFAIDQILSLISETETKGINDHDLVLQKNLAFDDGKPFFIDIGSFYHSTQNEPINQNKLFAKILPWIEENFPEFLPLLKEKLTT